MGMQGWAAQFAVDSLGFDSKVGKDKHLLRRPNKLSLLL
jgi:hypothetical protein